MICRIVMTLLGLLSLPGSTAGDTVVPGVEGCSSGGHKQVSHMQKIRLHLTWAAGRHIILPLTDVHCFSVIPVNHVPD